MTLEIATPEQDEEIQGQESNESREARSEALQRVDEHIEFYCKKMETHPIGQLINTGEFPSALAREFAEVQYVDSVLWIPMLALMRDRVQNPRLRRALADNIRCEAGVTTGETISHVTLCRKWVQSLGVSPSFGDFHSASSIAGHPVEIMNAAGDLSEPEIAGWLLSAERIVPDLFRLFRPAFAALPDVDMQYLDEHIAVDSDEHAVWMREAIADLLKSAPCLNGIIDGVDIGARTALSVPDGLYAKARRRLR